MKRCRPGLLEYQKQKPALYLEMFDGGKFEGKGLILVRFTVADQQGIGRMWPCEQKAVDD